MRTFMVTFGVIVLLAASGCGNRRACIQSHEDCAHTQARRLNFDARITGIWAEDKVSKVGQFGRFSLVRLGGCEIAIPVALDKLVETDSAVRMTAERRVKDREEKVTMLLGVALNPGTTASGTFGSGDGVFLLRSGWIFVWGQLPTVSTDWVSAGADGTTMAVELHKSGVHRVYFVKADGAEKVKLTSSAGSLEITRNGYFVDVNSNGSFTGPKRIADDTGAQKFVDDASKLARDAGWPG